MAKKKKNNPNRKRVQQNSTAVSVSTPTQSLPTTICLTMIVKNESKIILRCLEAAKLVVDFVSICDTGSTDNTIELIQDWGKKTNIPTMVHSELFKNFGYNRTLSVELAQKAFPHATYHLLLDADMILQVNPDFKKESLIKDKISLQQFDKCIKYSNVRLIRGSKTWTCVGVTHEYWDSPTEHTADMCSTLLIDDREDGGCKSDKYQRDKRLLTEGLKDKTIPVGLRSRYMFYLAQTCKDLGEFETAIWWYNKRIRSKDNFPEESFYAQYRMGTCYELWWKRMEQKLHFDIAKRETLAKRKDPSYERGKPCKICLKQDNHRTEDEFLETDLLSKEEFKQLYVRHRELFFCAISAFLSAWQMRPWRAEPLYEISRIYREKGLNDASLMFALKGKEIPYPKQDLLFIDFRIYEYLFDYEISIVAYYNEKTRDIGRSAFKRLMRIKDKLPDNINTILKSNSKFYK